MWFSQHKGDTKALGRSSVGEELFFSLAWDQVLKNVKPLITYYSFRPKSQNYTNTQGKLTIFFPHSFFSLDILFNIWTVVQEIPWEWHFPHEQLPRWDSIQFSGCWGANLSLSDLTLQVLICYYVREGKEKHDKPRSLWAKKDCPVWYLAYHYLHVIFACANTKSQCHKRKDKAIDWHIYWGAFQISCHVLRSIF